MSASLNKLLKTPHLHQLLQQLPHCLYHHLPYHLPHHLAHRLPHYLPTYLKWKMVYGLLWYNRTRHHAIDAWKSVGECPGIWPPCHSFLALFSGLSRPWIWSCCMLYCMGIGRGFWPAIRPTWNHAALVKKLRNGRDMAAYMAMSSQGSLRVCHEGMAFSSRIIKICWEGQEMILY